MAYLCRTFDPSLDGPHVLQWAKDRNYHYDIELLPPTTWIVPDVAVISVYLTNHPQVGFLDHLLSNPHTDAIERDKAVQHLIYTAITDTHGMGLKRLIMYTSNPAVVQRGIDRFLVSVTEPRSLMIFEHDKLMKGVMQ